VISQITIYNNSQRVAKTSKAFGVSITKELMRAYTLSASFLNNDSARQYITSGSQFEVDGQKYDITGFKQNSGSSNITQIGADHVGYRLNQYFVPAGYAFVSGVAGIAQDILNVSGANVEFSVGTCADVDGFFGLHNTEPVTARSALFALKALGVEVEFDNFTLNFPVTVGTGHEKVFEFGKDLCDFNRTWDKDNGATYDISIANLQRLAGHESESFDVGDTCIVKDSFVGDEISKRIISYTKCLDDPTQDTVTLGVFVRDSADDSVAMTMDISAAQEKANSSVQVGANYSNVSIDHENGFMAVNADATVGVKMNATNCFAIYSIKDGVWTLMNQLDSNGLQASRITSSVEGHKDVFATIGTIHWSGGAESNGFILSDAAGVIATMARSSVADDQISISAGKDLKMISSPGGTDQSDITLGAAEMKLSANHTIRFLVDDADCGSLDSYGFHGTFAIDKSLDMNGHDVINVGNILAGARLAFSAGGAERGSLDSLGWHGLFPDVETPSGYSGNVGITRSDGKTAILYYEKGLLKNNNA